MSGAASWIWGVILGDFNDDASEEEREKPENWLALSLTLIGCIPTFGSAVKGTCKVALKGGKGTSKDTLLAVLRGMGKGDPEKFLRQSHGRRRISRILLKASR
ncbi:Hypothetical protein VS_II0963 [Vibrio atlanticus]|uniref:Uncharacterized protein n=1 Tax=Vibrio atlanticus (strain LGP32) TaxID=575788 RepID=B7VTQ0_VIBA3|nr:Hypothetical protein VS_II0963 [Vibrio atlanticus]